jgi:Raf kinase inhibitor-like YbhB/YbcL family protein
MIACRGFVAQTPQSLHVTSSSITAGQIPPKFTCNGTGISPQLAWSAPPAATRTLALLVTDPDAPGGTFVHWVLYDLPATQRELPEQLPQQNQLADGAHQGRNDFGQIGYGGPCPPGRSPHRYVFALYALNTPLNLPTGATKAQVESAMQGHILARGELIARYHQ